MKTSSGDAPLASITSTTPTNINTTPRQQQTAPPAACPILEDAILGEGSVGLGDMRDTHTHTHTHTYIEGQIDKSVTDSVGSRSTDRCLNVKHERKMSSTGASTYTRIRIHECVKATETYGDVALPQARLAQKGRETSARLRRPFARAAAAKVRGHGGSQERRGTTCCETSKCFKHARIPRPRNTRQGASRSAHTRSLKP